MRNLIFAFFLVQISFNAQAQNMGYYFVDCDDFCVSQTILSEATTLSEINSRYRGDWVKTYISTEIQVSVNGQVESVSAQNETLTKAQRALLQKADINSELKIIVDYIPENELSHNPEQEMDFIFNVTPAKLAECPVDTSSLQSYIEENVIAKLTVDQRESVKNCALEFSIDADGSIIESDILESSGDAAIDKIVSDGICAMPKWKPAQKADGSRVKQKMSFYIGNRNYCMVPHNIKYQG